MRSVIGGPASIRGWRCRWLLLLVLPWLMACSRPAPEQQLRDRFTALQQAIEERRPGDAMAWVTEDFSGPQGMDRAALHNLLRAQMLMRDRVGVTTGPLDVVMQTDTAMIRFDALLTGAGRGRWVPDSARAYRVTTGWRREGDDWQLHHADWRADPGR